MPLPSTSALPLAVSAVVAGAVCASARHRPKTNTPAMNTIELYFCMAMLPKVRSIGNERNNLLYSCPAVRHQPLLRQEAALVVHLARAAYPITEIDVSQ